MPEMAQHRALRECPFGAQESYFQRLLLREAGGHDLAEQPQDLLVPQRAVITLAGHTQNLRLALRPVKVDRASLLGLRDAHELRQARTVTDELVDLLVDRVDPGAYLVQIQGGGGSSLRTRQAHFILSGHRSSQAPRGSAPIVFVGWRGF